MIIVFITWRSLQAPVIQLQGFIRAWHSVHVARWLKDTLSLLHAHDNSQYESGAYHTELRVFPFQQI